MTPATLHGPRITLRAWTDADLAPFAALNADAEVMRWFKAPLTREQSDAMAARIRANLALNGFGLWALQTPELEFAGFVRSQAVMQHIGLQRVGEFDHPNLAGHALQRHVLYATPEPPRAVQSFTPMPRKDQR